MFQAKSKYDEGDVVSLKLSSGEEILGKFVSEELSCITIDKALMIAMTAKGPAMAPFMMTIDPDKPVTFPKNSVVVTAPTLKEIADQYTFQTTGIQPVSAGSIIR